MPAGKWAPRPVNAARESVADVENKLSPFQTTVHQPFARHGIRNHSNLGFAMPKQRYRVLFVASHPVQYQAPLFQLLAARPEIDMHVAYCSLRSAEAAVDAEFETTVKWDLPILSGYRWTYVQNKGSNTESFLGLYNPGLWKLIRTGNYDAVISFVGYLRATFWIACLAAKLSKTGFLFGTDATTLAPRDGRAWKRVFKKVAWPRLFRLADQIIVPSSGTLDLLLSLGLPRERITLTPYTVNNEWWTQESKKVDRAAVRSSWGASPGDLVILFCAKLQPWKRPLDLLRAFAKAARSNAWLVFAGAGPLKAQLESEAKTLGVASRVRFLGFVNQSRLPAVYRSADVMVLPSEYEPFGVVVNEAMCCGCAVIASDRVGSARDLIAPTQSTFIYPCGDTDALADLLRRVATDRALLESVGRACLAHMRTWSPEHNITATMAAIRIAVNKVGRRSRKT
jgi:glycosyltransferase involved in cell wall biosynthesis